MNRPGYLRLSAVICYGIERISQTFLRRHVSWEPGKGIFFHSFNKDFDLRRVRPWRTRNREIPGGVALSP